MSEGKSDPARYFGRQVRKVRLAAGLTLADFGQRIGYDPGQISRIENGRRPPSELFAQMCDRAFPDRNGWFGEFYAESRTWLATPPWFRSWVEHEQHATALRNWQLGVLSGLLQTEDYARAILASDPCVTDDQVNARLAARLARQAILTRDDAPAMWFLVDEAALRRCVGSPVTMGAQLAHLAGVARLPNVRVPGIDGTDVRGMESNWRKSSYSGSNGGECVEVVSAETVMVRDTTDPNGPVLAFTAEAWSAFTAVIR